jgi:hypothetical protein
MKTTPSKKSEKKKLKQSKNKKKAEIARNKQITTTPFFVLVFSLSVFVNILFFFLLTPFLFCNQM